MARNADGSRRIFGYDFALWLRSAIRPFLDGQMGTTLSLIARPACDGRRCASQSSACRQGITPDFRAARKIWFRCRKSCASTTRCRKRSIGTRDGCCAFPLPGEGAVSPQLQPGGPSTLSIDQTLPATSRWCGKVRCRPASRWFSFTFCFVTGGLRFKAARDAAGGGHSRRHRKAARAQSSMCHRHSRPQIGKGRSAVCAASRRTSEGGMISLIDQWSSGGTSHDAGSSVERWRW